MLFDLSMISGFAEWTYLVGECNAHGSVSFVFCCVLFCVFVVASLVVLLVVLEFENGSREEEFCCFPCRSVAISGWPVLRAWHLGLCG